MTAYEHSCTSFNSIFLNSVVPIITLFKICDITLDESINNPPFLTMYLTLITVICHEIFSLSRNLNSRKIKTNYHKYLSFLLTKIDNFLLQTTPSKIKYYLPISRVPIQTLIFYPQFKKNLRIPCWPKIDNFLLQITPSNPRSKIKDYPPLLRVPIQTLIFHPQSKKIFESPVNFCWPKIDDFLLQTTPSNPRSKIKDYLPLSRVPIQTLIFHPQFKKIPCWPKIKDILRVSSFFANF